MVVHTIHFAIKICIRPHVIKPTIEIKNVAGAFNHTNMILHCQCFIKSKPAYGLSINVSTLCIGLDEAIPFNDIIHGFTQRV